MRGINKVLISGTVSRMQFNETGKGTPVCTFLLTTERHTPSKILSTIAKINAYGDGLVYVCKNKIAAGSYVIVEGELMNRDGELGLLTEVRAREIISSLGAQKEE